VLAVMAAHTFVPGMGIGHWGVDLFFVLSGFLITSLLKAEAEATGSIRLGAFYLRRIRRLYPALLLMLALYLVAWPSHGRDALVAALYLSDYAMAFLRESIPWHLHDALSHTWSLSVEEHFYLLWPAVVLGLALIRVRRAVVYLLLAAYLAATFWRLWSHLHIGWFETYYRFDTRTSGLILGALLAYLPELKHRAWALAVPMLALMLWRAADPLVPAAFASTPAEWLGAALVLWAMAGSKLLAWRPLAYTGRISYGLYLYHWPIAYALQQAGLPWWQMAPIVLLVTFTLAHFSHKYWEARFRQATMPSMDVRMPEVSAA
jgi:peptidoglycan/LPS O-acetylase OafA/YrhL